MRLQMHQRVMQRVTENLQLIALRRRKNQMNNNNLNQMNNNNLSSGGLFNVLMFDLLYPFCVSFFLSEKVSIPLLVCLICLCLTYAQQIVSKLRDQERQIGGSLKKKYQ